MFSYVFNCSYYITEQGFSPHLFVWVGAVVAEHQVGPSAVEQQVCGSEGQGEALHALTEVKGVPQVAVSGVDEKVLQ